MRGTYVFDLLDVVVGRVLDQAASCPADKRDTILPGFSNNVRWQVGHILATTDGALHGFTGMASPLSESYRKSFGNGTKPADWNDETPDWDAIIANLREMPARLRATFESKLDSTLPENFAKAKTLDELLVALTGHINLHLGQISAMIRTLRQ